MKKKLAWFLLLIWMFIIFYLSNQNATISSDESGGTLRFILNLLHFNNVDDIVNIIHGPIREAMHAFEYFILGILSLNVIRFYNIKKCIIFSIGFCLMYSLSDEIHQIFIPGRTFQFIDLFLDFIGSLLGIYLLKFILKIKSFK